MTLVDPFFIIATLLSVAIIGTLFFQIFKWDHRARNSSHFDYLLNDKNENWIVVLGASASIFGPSLELLERLMLAKRIGTCISPSLYHLTGGFSGVSEPLVMKEYLNSVGVLDSQIQLDESGFNTRESLQNLRKSDGFNENLRLLVVTSGFHACRVRQTGRQLGLQIMVISPFDSPESRNKKVKSIRVVMEVFALIWYRLPICFTQHVNTKNGSFRHRIPNWLISLVT